MVREYGVGVSTAGGCESAGDTECLECDRERVLIHPNPGLCARDAQLSLGRTASVGQTQGNHDDGQQCPPPPPRYPLRVALTLQRAEALQLAGVFAQPGNQQSSTL